MKEKKGADAGHCEVKYSFKNGAGAAMSLCVRARFSHVAKLNFLSPLMCTAVTVALQSFSRLSETRSELNRESIAITTSPMSVTNGGRSS